MTDKIKSEPADFGFPPDRRLPDSVRAQARTRIVAGLRAERRPRQVRALVPISIAAAVVVIVGGAVGLVVMNHNQPANPAAGPTSSISSTTTATSTAPDTTTSPGRPPLRFPDTNLTVRFTGYDDATRMVTFEVVTFVPGGPDDGHYTPDTHNPGSHRLPLAASPTITALSTLCANATTTVNPVIDAVPCTPARFVASLRATPGDVAQMHVDATDHIDTVHEVYHP
jgi:hypothetical protein